jgi:hypothetical protein
MFRSKKTKILSTPVEEVLEVELPIEDEWEEPEPEQITNIEFLAIKYTENEMEWGTLTNYDGYEFSYQWDTKTKRIVRLVGHRIDKLTWDLCNDVLHKYYIKPEPPKVEEPIGPQIEQAIGKVLSPVNNAIKTLEGKVEKALAAKAAPAPAPVQAAPAPRPQAVQSTPMDTPAISVGDDDISINAARFLQNSNVNDLGIDYMSL